MFYGTDAAQNITWIFVYILCNFFRIGHMDSSNNPIYMWSDLPQGPDPTVEKVCRCKVVRVCGRDTKSGGRKPAAG